MGDRTTRARRRATEALALGVAVPLLLSSCVVADNLQRLNEATLAPTSPSASPTPLLGDQNGDSRISVWEQEQLDKAAGIPYTLPDGTTVQVVADQPLPPEVQAAVTAAIAPSAQQTTDAILTGSREAIAAADAARDAAFGEQEAATGKELVLVKYGVWEGARRWTVGVPAPTVQGGFATEAEATAYANEFAATNPKYAVIVAD